MIQPLILWGHALAALLFAVLAVSQVRGAGSALPRLTFLIALGMTALWALAVAGIDAHELAPRVTESLRNLAWLAFMYALVRRRSEEHTSELQSLMRISYAVFCLKK